MAEKSKTLSLGTETDLDQNTLSILTPKTSQTSEPSFAKTLSIDVKGQILHFSEAKFVHSNCISLLINNEEYIYNRSKSYKDLIYFQCKNRKRTDTQGKKCLAKIHFHPKSNSIEIIDQHNANCKKLILSSNDNYMSQKETLITELSANPTITVVKAMDYLRKVNSQVSEENKKQPLEYEQVKKIVRDFREDNFVNSEQSLSDPSLLKTKDNAIFRRCHNNYDVLYKNRHITNQYAIYCSPFQEKLLSCATHWHIDGTFYVVPCMFYQLLVILIYDDCFGAYIPACFILASHKNKQSYSSIFRDVAFSVLKNNYRLQRITIDFEDALKGGVNQVFENIEIIGCKFHFLQALMRKAKKRGIKE